jgi:hypothetical protein
MTNYYLFIYLFLCNVNLFNLHIKFKINNYVIMFMSIQLDAITFLKCEAKLLFKNKNKIAY